MYSLPVIRREDAVYDIEEQNRLLEAAGVTEAEFIFRFYGDSYEIGLVLDGGKRTHWFWKWSEAQKLVMSTFPEADWEETGWTL
jgi:hypothetical protein